MSSRTRSYANEGESLYDDPKCGVDSPESDFECEIYISVKSSLRLIQACINIKKHSGTPSHPPSCTPQADNHDVTRSAPCSAQTTLPTICIMR